jgi:putative ATP-binding cassette transporter
MRIFTHPLWSRFFTIARPFFASEARAKAIGGLVLLAVLLLAVNGLNFINSYIMRDFMTALAEQNPRFYIFGLALAGVYGLASIGEALEYYTEQRMGLFWRAWLTRRLLDRYLAHRAYHRLTVNRSIDNPDERISEDVKTFTTSSLSFIVLLLNAVLALALFLGVLWSITPWLVLTAVLYSAAGSLATILLGWKLVPLNNYQLQKEADFRFALIRVREQAGPDDLQGGGEEKATLLERFNKVVANFRDIISVTRNVGFFTKEYNYLIQIIPALVVAPLYIHNHVQFGTIPQAAMAFGQVVGAFSLIVTQYPVLSTFAAVVHRLGSMWEATESAGAPSAAGAALPPEEAEQKPARLEMVEDNKRVAYEKLTLWTSEKRVLIRDLTLEIPEGQRLMVSGPTGSGKTALALASAGLWGEGRGTIRCPGMRQIMFLPQQIYAATGRLRDLLLAGLDRDNHDDEQLRGALRDVGLGYLADEPEGLDSQWSWVHGLLPGDQHALALARLLLAKPRFAFLDGVPWTLPPRRVQHLYTALARTPITYISIGDSTGLLPYHDQWLELLGDGRWRLRQTNVAEETSTETAGHRP